tara:strand:- start:137 stop:466 length:330 start_codon:yes stop_codon:yes gene_type:complete
MRYFLLASLLVTIGCAPSATPNTTSIANTKAICSTLAASYEAAKTRKNKIESLANDRKNIGIEEALFSWPSMAAERIKNLSDANAASKKMRDLKKDMKKRNCEGLENLD